MNKDYHYHYYYVDIYYFIHKLQNFGKRTSERGELVDFPKFCNE